MNSGFFNNDGDYDFLENTKVNGHTVDALQFLHGNCHTFAVVTAELLSANVGLWTEYDEEMGCEVLIHAFVVESKNNEAVYIDVRGVTDSFEDIVDGFDYMYEPSFNILTITEAESKLKSMGITMSDIITAKKILNYYIVNYKN